MTEKFIKALTMNEKSVNQRNSFRAWKDLDHRLKQKKVLTLKGIIGYCAHNAKLFVANN